MKKSLNFLLILSIICLALISVLCFSSIVFNEFNFPFTNEVAENFNNMEEGNPGSGWYLLFAGGVALLGDFTILFFFVFLLIFVPFVMNFLIVIIQGVARLFQIGLEKKWKNIVGKVLTVISIIIEILLCIILLFIFISNVQVSKILLFLALTLNITTVVLFIREFINMNKVNVMIAETPGSVETQ